MPYGGTWIVPIFLRSFCSSLQAGVPALEVPLMPSMYFPDKSSNSENTPALALNADTCNTAPLSNRRHRDPITAALAVSHCCTRCVSLSLWHIWDQAMQQVHTPKP